MRVLLVACNGNETNMKTIQAKQKVKLVALLIPALFLADARPAAARPHAPSGEVVITWNQLLADTVRLGLQPATIRVERSYAMLHVAMFDAVNSIEQKYTPYRFQVRASAGASAEAAAAQAAHDILVALYPSQKSVYDAALRADLSGIPRGRARQGRSIGAAIAAQVLAWRTNDGWEVTPPAYVLPPLPGNWQPTPPALTPARFTHYQDVLPFAIEGPEQFLAPPPPALDSPAYTAAFNEAKELGATNSSTRTTNQTLMARLYASVGTFATPNTLWNGVARDVSRAYGLGLVETARVFALLSVVFHDALQVSFAGKYTYGLWRPVTAIRSADLDSNPNTVQDAGWTSLLSSPPYPTYPGNAAALSAASARALALLFGRDDVPITVVFEGNGAPDVTRSYDGFWEFAEEQAQSRIWGGIHFSFDTIASQEASVELVDWVFERFMLPE
jgi:hypothetical protein